MSNGTWNIHLSHTILYEYTIITSHTILLTTIIIKCAEFRHKKNPKPFKTWDIWEFGFYEAFETFSIE